MQLYAQHYTVLKQNFKTTDTERCTLIYNFSGNMYPPNVKHNIALQGTADRRKKYSGARYIEQGREKVGYNRFRLQQRHGLFHNQIEGALATGPQIRDTD